MQARLSSALDVKKEKMCIHLTSTQMSSNIVEIIDNAVTVMQLWTNIRYPVLAAGHWDKSVTLVEIQCYWGLFSPYYVFTIPNASNQRCFCWWEDGEQLPTAEHLFLQVPWKL